MSSVRVLESLKRPLYVVVNEDNLSGSEVNPIWPSTILDQVFDNESSTNKDLRTILDEIRQEIITGGQGNILFPVDSVNGMTGDVVLNKNNVGLNNVDNTKDIDKPLSNPQREEVKNMISNIDLKQQVDFSELYNHMLDSDNPHGVTLDQLNTDNKLDNLINQLIAKHNLSGSSTVHSDIRRSINNINSTLDNLNDNITNRFDLLSINLDKHLYDVEAHTALFKSKEDIENKINYIDDDDLNNDQYPTTNAVAEYIKSKINDYDKLQLKIENWIKDISVVESRDRLPTPNEDTFQKVYFIKYGYNSTNEIAVCRKNMRNEYEWDITDLGAITKFNMDHFANDPNGLSINLSIISNEILNNYKEYIINAIKDNLPDYIIDTFYNKSEIDAMHLLNQINIVPGTMFGCIRFYINGNKETMSNDIKIPGLQRLAFLEHVTEHELAEESVHEQHILSKALVTRHFNDKAVTSDKISCSYNHILGNVSNGEDQCREISLEELGSKLALIIGDVEVEIPEFSVCKNDKIIQMVNDVFEEE